MELQANGPPLLKLDSDPSVVLRYPRRNGRFSSLKFESPAFDVNSAEVIVHQNGLPGNKKQRSTGGSLTPQSITSVPSFAGRCSLQETFVHTNGLVGSQISIATCKSSEDPQSPTDAVDEEVAAMRRRLEQEIVSINIWNVEGATPPNGSETGASGTGNGYGGGGGSHLTPLGNSLGHYLCVPTKGGDLTARSRTCSLHSLSEPGSVLIDREDFDGENIVQNTTTERIHGGICGANSHANSEEFGINSLSDIKKRRGMFRYPSEDDETFVTAQTSLSQQTSFDYDTVTIPMAEDATGAEETPETMSVDDTLSVAPTVIMCTNYETTMMTQNGGNYISSSNFNTCPSNYLNRRPVYLTQLSQKSSGANGTAPRASASNWAPPGLHHARSAPVVHASAQPPRRCDSNGSNLATSLLRNILFRGRGCKTASPEVVSKHSSGSHCHHHQSTFGIHRDDSLTQVVPSDEQSSADFEVDSLHDFDPTGNEDYENVTLMYAKHEKIPMKDFGSEVRASMDVDHLLNKAVLLLDLPETSLEDIFGKIIHEMDIQEPEFTSDQVKNALFTQDSGNQFHILSRTVQSICTTNMTGGAFDYDQSWICALCMLPSVQHRHVAIARLTHPTNLGRTMQDLRFIIIVIAPSRAKGTKTALETSRTFATLFADMDIRQRLVTAQGVDLFRQTLLAAAKELAIEQTQWRERRFSLHLSDAKEQLLGPNKWYLGRGLRDDVTRRLMYYISDYKDGISELKSVQKLFSTIVFLYFACLLPSIAFGVLNDDNTFGAIGVKKAVFAQAIGGLFFSIFGGQPMIIVLTTAPLALYIKILFKISADFNLDFFAMYACVGLWCAFFLILYATTELSSIMKWATRSAEDIFSLFIALAFVVEAFKSLNLNFRQFYHAPACDYRSPYKNSTIPPGGGDVENTTMAANVIAAAKVLGNFTTLPDAYTKQPAVAASTVGGPVAALIDLCQRENSILYILLMFGTLWLGLFLYNFRKTPYLTRAKREILADYALPMSVIVMSFTGAFCFRDVQIVHFNFDEHSEVGNLPQIHKLPFAAIFGAMGLGFCLSLLFFIDQNITSAIVNNPQNKLKKGSATHLDLFVVAILNTVLSLMGLPWMHGSLPHSPLHVRALADVEERVSQGHVHEVITNVRETRLASMIAHSLIGMSAIFMLPYPLAYIPRAVLDGLFLYMAVTSVNGNEMFERVLLLATEQAAYPPTHYIRRVPQRKVHTFTVCQLLQLMLVCTFGFTPYPYVEMVFPMIIFLFLPIRHMFIPKIIDYKYLDALDGRH